MEPWECYPSVWKSKTAFFAYLRGAIRRIWSRYPAKLEWKKTQLTTEKPEGYKGRGKKFGKCAYCGEMFVASHLEVDHIIQVGECNSWETARQFMERLLNCNGNWCLACKTCHKIKSHAERLSVSFEEARLQKLVIEWMKQSKATIVAMCKSKGYNEHSLTNTQKRREAVEAILRKELSIDK